jgi:hypothetical protein
MGRFHKTSELGCRYQRNILRTPAPDNDDFLILNDLVQDRSKPVTQICVCCFHCLYCTGFLYAPRNTS